MRKLLVAINVLLVFLILGVAFLFNPEIEQAPLPGTHAARVGGDVPETAAQPAAAAVAAAGGAAGQIGVDNAYVRLAPPGITVTGAYMTLKNSGAGDVQLVAAQATAARSAELHSHVNDGGVMRMRQVEAVAVPAGGAVQLQPGGFHLMLIDLQTTLQEGERVGITLMFADGSSRQIEAPVVRPGAAMGHRN